MSRLLGSKIIKALVVCIALIVCTWLLFRSCSTNQEKRTYRIGRDPTWYPLEFYEKDQAMTAFTTELLAAIAKEENLNFEIISSSSDALISDLQGGDYDAILTSLTPSVALRQQYLFSEPFYRLGIVLIVRSISTVTSLDDVKGRQIGIETNSATLNLLQQYPTIVPVAYDNQLKALSDLVNNKIDGVLMEAFQAYIYTTGYYSGKLKVATSPLTDFGLRLVALRKKAETLLIYKFDLGLKAMKNNGEYSALLNRWKLFNPEMHENL